MALKAMPGEPIAFLPARFTEKTVQHSQFGSMPFILIFMSDEIFRNAAGDIHL